MKKRSREINVFSMSALDLFASALGAFVLMSMVFMVFFMMTSRNAGELEATRAALAQCEVELAQSEAGRAEVQGRLNEALEELAGTVDCRAVVEQVQRELSSCQERIDGIEGELRSCQRALKQTFLLVVASWSSRTDVDLHVVDPAGREFFYENRRFSGSPAALEEDTMTGPGNEVWLHPSSEPGRYRVCYNLYSGRSASVRGSLLWQEGKLDLPNVDLDTKGEMTLAVEIDVDDQGSVALVQTGTGHSPGFGSCR